MEPKEEIKKARFGKKLTQSDVAKALGISLRMYQRYEEGKFPKYKDATINALDKVLGTDIYSLLYDKGLSHVDVKPSNILPAEGVEITLQDYLELQKEMIDRLSEDKERLFTLLNSSLVRISDDQQIALAYQKAWVEYEAEKSAKGDPKKKREIISHMGKLVDGKLMGDVKEDKNPDLGR